MLHTEYTRLFMEIKKLNDETLIDAIQLKIFSWTEELAGVTENNHDFDKEYQLWLAWSHTAEENQDVRFLYGMFDRDYLIGAVFSSFAEIDDHPNAIEINGLWVDGHYRNQKISIKLLHHILKLYQSYNKDKVIVYNHKLSPSNSYYYHLGGEVIRSEYQMDGKLYVDIFLYDYKVLYDLLENRIAKNDI